MSIYATQWCLKFPRQGDYHTGCEWLEVTGQGVLAHIGSPTEGCGYENGDPYAAFLPPAINASGEDEWKLRAVVIVTEETRKGTARCGQEYENPLLVLSGEEYSNLSFRALHDRICDALRGGQPRLMIEAWMPDGSASLIFDDGSRRIIRKARDEKAE
jgi:hypothetical protein